MKGLRGQIPLTPALSQRRGGIIVCQPPNPAQVEWSEVDLRCPLSLWERAGVRGISIELNIVEPIGLQSFGVGQQLGNAREQAAGGAAVEHAMIEAERYVGFHHRHKLAFGFIPARHAPRRPHPQH